MCIENGGSLWTHLATFSAVARKLRRSHHILWVTHALAELSPSLTTCILITAIHVVSHDLVERIDTNPLCCWPFLAFNHRAPSMQTTCVWNSIWMKAEEQKSVAFPWFHWISQARRLKSVKKKKKEKKKKLYDELKPLIKTMERVFFVYHFLN